MTKHEEERYIRDTTEQEARLFSPALALLTVAVVTIAILLGVLL